jgi:hypothetical protein
MLAVDLERAGKSERNLGNTGEVFNIAPGDVRVKGILE